jgi:geranylgeranyl pyrophosphate synthase
VTGGGNTADVSRVPDADVVGPSCSDGASTLAAHELAFVEFMARGRTEVDGAIERWLPRPPSCPPAVAEAMRYAVGAGGKRFRPLLTLASADSVADARGSSPSERVLLRQRALPAACAIELVHTQSLVHDDLPAMDDDVLRRGLPTVHVRYGEGLAILVGDALLAEAFGLLAREPAHDHASDLVVRKLRVIATLGEAIGASGMVGGQAVDLMGARSDPYGPGPRVDIAALSDMHARKTGGLVRAAAVAGAIMAGGDDDQIAAVDVFAGRVGLAFQIVDDVLDVEGDARHLGKTAGKDARAGKPTFASLVGCERARAMVVEILADAEVGLVSAGLGSPTLLGLARLVATRPC